VEIYFQIVHSRLPLLNPAQFRNRLRLHLSSTPPSEEPLHPALVATVIAWGTKFSEHPLLTADRNCHKGQSLLSKMIIDRTRDLAEALKVHRLPTPDHVVIGLLIETLQSRKYIAPSGLEVLRVILQRFQTILVVGIQLRPPRLHLDAYTLAHSFPRFLAHCGDPAST